MKVGTDGVLLGAWADCQSARQVLDVGTGSGLIALMLAQRTAPDCQIDGVDIDPGACQQAALNFQHSPWPQRLSVAQADLLNWQANTSYDLIVSNPPYFVPGPKISCQQRRQARYSEQLDAARLIAGVQGMLQPQGSVAMVLPYASGEQLLNSEQLCGMQLWRRCDVLTKPGHAPQRMLLQLTLEPRATEHQQLAIYAQPGQYSTQFIALTREFYLRM